jgi:raffinose/stachyose/melibiose transport system permease protein
MIISRSERILTYAVLVVAAFFAIYPLALIAISALGPDQVGAGGGLHPENFVTAWQRGSFGGYLRNSILVSALVVIIAGAASSLAGYAFALIRFPGSTGLFYLLLLGLMVPSEAVIIPLYYDLRTLGLTDSYLSLVFPQAAQSLGFGTFWMRAYFRSTPREVIEAARMDGAGHGQIFARVLLPMGRPALLTMVLLIFMWTWNEFLLPLVMITDESLRTAPLGLSAFQGQYTSGTALLSAAAVLVALPVVIVFLFTQRHFINGMLEGAVKA